MVWDDEGHRHGTQEEWAFKSRTFTGQIVGIDEENGKLSVQLLGSRQKYDVDAPVVGLSVRGVKSSWMRHMPQVRDYVDISFGPDNRPKLHRVTAWKFRSDSGGWAEIAKAAAANDGNLGLVWRKLKQGEFDCRSSGGAGYYFTADGHAVLEAGPTAIELDKNRFESFGTAGLWVRRGDGVEVRFGDVKRLLTGTFEETSAVVNPTGAVKPKEWFVEVGYPTPPAGTPKCVFYREQAGDVRDSLGAPVLLAGQPLRYRKQLFNAAGLVETLTVEVDALGNTKVTHAATAVPGGLEIAGGSLSPFKLSYGSVEVNATTTATIKATTTAKVEGTAALELASGGLAATHPMVYGDLLMTAFNAHVHATAFGPTIGPPVPVLLGPGVDMSLTTKVS